MLHMSVEEVVTGEASALASGHMDSGELCRLELAGPGVQEGSATETELEGDDLKDELGGSCPCGVEVEAEAQQDKHEATCHCVS
jgi:hypothetical protein